MKETTMSERILKSGLEGAFPSFPAADDQLERGPSAVDSLGWEAWGEIGAKSLPRSPQLKRALLPTTGVHPAVIKIALSAIVWLLAVTWLNFTGGVEVDFALAVVTGFFVVFFTLLLLTASMVVDDPRWEQPKASFTNFLKDEVPIDRGTMRGRDVVDPHRPAAGDTRHRRHADRRGLDSDQRVVVARFADRA
jgi:hypothetical protein